MPRRFAPLLLSALVAAGCDDPRRGPSEVVRTDAGQSDAGPSDGRTADPRDATSDEDAEPTALDATFSDASPSDAAPSDAEARDADPRDAEPTDRGVTLMDAGVAPVTATTDLTYSDGTRRHFDGCYYCDATLDSGAGSTLLRFQVGSGYTIWSLTLPRGTSAGTTTLQPGFSGVYLSLSESDGAVPSAVRGSYLPPSQSGTVHLTEANFTRGGVVAGEVDAQLTNGASPGVTVHLVATFRARL